MEAACADLLGTNLRGLSTTSTPAGLSGEMITAADCAEVSKAIKAVSLKTSDPIVVCGYTPLLVPTEALCESATNNAIFKEDWESGIGSWTLEQLPENAATWESRDWEITSTLPEGRTGNAIFATNPVNGDCAADLQNGIIRLQGPVITIPSSMTTEKIEMSFDHYVATEPDYDGGNLKYSLNGGEWSQIPNASFTANPYTKRLTPVFKGNDNPMQNQLCFTGTDEGTNLGSWGTSTIDLSSLGVLPNSTIQFRFELGGDGCNGNDGWYVDNISIYDCSAVLAVSKFDLLLKDIAVYPNPTDNTFTIRKLASLNLIKAEVFDINGRKLKEADLSEMNASKEIDINEFKTGIYFVTITSDTSKATIKLIKQ